MSSSRSFRRQFLVHLTLNTWSVASTRRVARLITTAVVSAGAAYGALTMPAVQALVVLNGDTGDAAWLATQAAAAELVVAADGAADLLFAAGCRPGLVVGDLDSLRPATLALLEEAGIPIERHPVEKDETDGELALRAALARGATVVHVAGALGGARIDHSIASLTLLTLPGLERIDVTLVTPTDTARLVRGPASQDLAGSPGDIVSLLPFSERVSGVTTAGLRYALDDATLERGPTLGVSNELVDSEASVTIGEGLLIITTHRAYH